jgi:AcrR family transcriptional regulator
VITRDELVSVAARVIGELGYDGASMRRIASDAGVSLGTLQHHFKTKDQLWKALVDEVLVPKVVQGAPTPVDGFGSILSVAIGTRLKGAVMHPGLSGVLLTDNSPGGEERLRYFAEATSAVRERDRAFLGLLQKHGQLRQIDVDAFFVTVGIALACISSAKGASRHLVGIDLDDEAQRDRLVDGITDLLLNGVLPRDKNAAG